uniref:Down syndrome cell adhesion molecule homolog n=1 Tax=Dermatophagoides pteronyssinus TaxID=6956 RepID=A0A6P6Y2A0_DERPT|nr:Down syndrome cell adhesion molecule homolog [Dermatophagoides pteronyssinus]
MFKMLIKSFIVIHLLIFISIVEANVAPKLQPIIPKFYQSLNSNLKIFCTIQHGSKPFRFEWHRNDRQLLANLKNVNYRIETLGDDDSMLIMERLGSNDSGNYSCIARNSYGMDRQRTQIIVTGLSQNFS